VYLGEEISSILSEYLKTVPDEAVHKFLLFLVTEFIKLSPTFDTNLNSGLGVRIMLQLFARHLNTVSFDFLQSQEFEDKFLVSWDVVKHKNKKNNNNEKKKKEEEEEKKEEVIYPLNEKIIDLDNVKAFVWFLGQFIFVDESLALTVWMKFLFPFIAIDSVDIPETYRSLSIEYWNEIFSQYELGGLQDSNPDPDIASLAFSRYFHLKCLNKCTKELFEISRNFEKITIEKKD